jgi:hypothetical protein
MTILVVKTLREGKDGEDIGDNNTLRLAAWEAARAGRMGSMGKELSMSNSLTTG